MGSADFNIPAMIDAFNTAIAYVGSYQYDLGMIGGKSEHTEAKQ